MRLISLIWIMPNLLKQRGGKGYTIKSASEVDAIVEEALAQDVPTIVDVYVDPNAAPLPGKIVNEEALGYGKWAFRSITEDKYLDLDQIPPISVAAKRFL